MTHLMTLFRFKLKFRRLISLCARASAKNGFKSVIKRHQVQNGVQMRHKSVIEPQILTFWGWPA